MIDVNIILGGTPETVTVYVLKISFSSLTQKCIGRLKVFDVVENIRKKSQKRGQLPLDNYFRSIVPGVKMVLQGFVHFVEKNFC